MRRRLFLRQVLAAPFLVPAWRSSAPRDYMAELGELMRAGPVPGVVIGSVQGLKLGWIAPLGVQTEGLAERVSGSTLFHAASMTKQVVAHAAFILRGQGKLDFDRPLVAYVDDLRDAGARKVTIQQVLSHSSGFPNWRTPDSSGRVPDLVPAFEPGSRFQYSGEGYFYLQRVMEEVLGMGIGRILNDLVFGPLGMRSTVMVWDPGTLGRTASPHNGNGKAQKDWDKTDRALRAYAGAMGKAVEDLRYEEYAAANRQAGNPDVPAAMNPNAAGSLVTSAEDYARFVVGAMQNAGEIARQRVAINEFLGWGTGWGIERAAGKTYLWQWGDNGGFKNFVLAEPATGDVIFVFTNGAGGTRVYDRVLTHATGQDHPALFWLS